MAKSLSPTPDPKGRNAAFEESQRNFEQLFQPLMEDAKTALRAARENPSGYNRRVAFRAVFSAVEGITFLLKDQLLAGLDPDGGIYSTAEIALLREQGYQLDNRGNAVARTRFLPVADNLLFTWKMYFRNVLPEFDPGLESKGWKEFQAALATRNRITHPRSGVDLNLSDDDINSLIIAFDWVQGTTFQNMAAAVLYMRKRQYGLWDQLLSKETLGWLDKLHEHDRLTFDAMRDKIRSFSPSGLEIPKAIVSSLVQWELAENEGDSICLTADCVLYMKWRAKEQLFKPAGLSTNSSPTK